VAQDIPLVLSPVLANLRAAKEPNGRDPFVDFQKGFSRDAMGTER
jgi:hypothetical protein